MSHQHWERFIADLADCTESAETIDSTVERLTVDRLTGERLTNKVSQLLADQVEIVDFFKVKFVDQTQHPHFAYYPNRTWRKFLLSTYYADLLCYPAKADQVDFPRLAYLLSCAPEGFTVWWAEFANGQNFPVGYTGWYAVEETTFHQVEQLQYRDDLIVTNRFFLPAKKQTPYLYLFNYSIVPELKQTRFSSALIKSYAAEIHRIQFQGLFCATVSEDGSRVAEKFKMKQVGVITSEAGVPLDKIYLLTVRRSRSLRQAQ